MVNVTLTANSDPLRDLAFSYAPKQARAGLEALFALDDALGQVLRTTREPMVGQMRLAWWREALVALDDAPPPGEPVLQGLAAHVLPAGISGEELARMIEGWEVLLGEFDAMTPGAHATLRGAILFRLAGRVLRVSPDDPVREAGEIWALADLSRHLNDAAVVATVRAELKTLTATPSRTRWSRNGRALGALALIPQGDASGTGAKAMVFRLLRHRLTGR